jgi:hypothetical protein
MSEAKITDRTNVLLGFVFIDYKGFQFVGRIRHDGSWGESRFTLN